MVTTSPRIGRRSRRLRARQVQALSVSVWHALNSGIVLWLLSSVVLAGLTQWWSHRQSELTLARMRHEQERRLRIEMTDRLMALGLSLHPSNDSYAVVTQACKASGICEPDRKLSGFAEFNERSFS